MVKVIIGRRVKEGEDISPLLRELRAAAIHQTGYVTGETLVNVKDKLSVTTISTWRSAEDWKVWETSEVRTVLNKRVEPFLIEKPVVKIYQVMVTENKRG